MSQYHIPVMLEEVLNGLNIKPGHWYIDCNLGGGGHTEAILNLGGKVLGIDLDQDAINEVAKKYGIKVEIKENKLQANSDNLILYQSNFSDIDQVVAKTLNHQVSGILFDLGVSTHQLDQSSRGFSFNMDAPLDMRMDQSQNIKAADLINGLREDELTKLFSVYGEERFAKPIARKIVEYRKLQPIETTNQLANTILRVRPRTKSDRTHPATRVFQALRIAVNDELESLKTALPQALELLEPTGRLVVISFHSLEDRIVKNFFKEQQDNQKLRIISIKPIIPTENEIESNPRSRSGKLRVAEKI